MQKIFPLRISRKLVRAILWPLVILLFITVGIPALSFFYWFDAAKVKKIVISQFNNQNYAVVINGNVEPRSWHGFSLFISDLTVQDKEQHKILHVNTANCQLSWLDLIIGHYKVKRIALNGVTFHQSGINKVNYSNLLDYNTIHRSEFSNLISGSLTNLNLIDWQGNYLIRDANLSVLHLDSQPVFHLGFKIAPYKANVNINGQVSKISDGKLWISSLTTKIVNPNWNIAVQSSGHYSYLTQELWIEGSQGQIQSKNYSGVVNVATALLTGYGLTVNGLDADINNLLSNNKQIYTIKMHKISTDDFKKYSLNDTIIKYSVTSKRRKLYTVLELENSEVDKSFNLVNDSCNLNLSYSPIESTISNSLSASLHGNCSYLGLSNKVKLALSGKIDDAPAQLQIIYSHEKSKPLVKVSGNLTSLNLNRLFPSTNKNELIPLYSDNSKLPFNWLSWFDLDADLNFKTLSMSQVDLSDLSTKIKVQNNQLKFTDLQAKAYGGKINGSGSIVKNNESYTISLQNQINGIDLQRLFASLFNVNAIVGRAELAVAISAKDVVTYENLHQKLDGNINLQVNNGGFNGIDFNLFLKPENLTNLQGTQVLNTNFTSLKANFNFKNGISNRSNIIFSSPTIAASGNGLIDFAATKIDYKLKVSSILPDNVQKIKSVSIPVEINGDLFSPKIYIQNMTLNGLGNRRVLSRHLTASKTKETLKAKTKSRIKTVPTEAKRKQQ